MLIRAPMLGTSALMESRRQLADVEEPSVTTVGVEPARTVEVAELGQILAFVVEDLHPMILAVRDVHEALGVGGDIVWDVETARVGTRLAPREEQTPLGIVFVDARISVPVRHVDVAVLRTQRDVRRPVEGLAAVEGRGLVGVPQGQQQLALGRELPDGMVQVVGEPKRAVRADRDSWARRNTPSPVSDFPRGRTR
jgi:hypothetical protein